VSNFFVLGLPRSRTAWLANFLTYDGMRCHHEGTNECHSLKQYQFLLADDEGDSNTGLVIIDIKKFFPDAKIVIIDSDPDKAIEYSRRTFGMDCAENILIMKEKLDAMGGLHVALEDINLRLLDIWDYLTGLPFDDSRANMLINMDIQIKDPHTMDISAAQDFINDCNSQ